ANATTYYLAVTAYDDAGNESENYSVEVSATPAHAAADTEAPTVVSAEAANKNMVRVVFSEPVILPDTDPELAFNVKNDTTQVGLEATGAETDNEDITGKTVLLMTATQQAGATYIITAGIQVKDGGGNTIVSGTSDTALFTGTDVEPAPAPTQETLIASADTTGPELVDVMASDNTHVIVVFSEPVVLAADPLTNFYITEAESESSLDIVSATLSSDKTTVTLMTVPQQNMAYNLIALDVKDEAGNDIDVANNATTFDGNAAGAGTQETTETEESQMTEETQADMLAPEDVTNLMAQMLKQMIVTLSWTASLNSAGDLANYVLYKSTDGQTYGEGVLLEAAVTSVDVTNLVPGIKYFFKLTAKDAAGNESAGVISMFQLPETGPELALLLAASMGAGKFLKRKKRGLKK
ncbi:MAG TPA: fibronectin type III domain-containing protein, partial [Candidatus Gracilibacteria bacterium]|nr:fibronectin type III domain-containing protein [Candidatus Gracilibacteria bacterium]